MKPRIEIKRGKNKKYYSTHSNGYVNMNQILEFVKDDEVDLVIVDREGNDILDNVLKEGVKKLNLSREVMTELVRKYL